MADFNADDKKEITQTAGFYEEGVYTIKIVDVTGGVTDKGSEYFEFEVVGNNGEEGTVRTYFTDAAKPYSFNTIRNIFVHNTPEKNKEIIKKSVEDCANTTDLLTLCEALRGKDAWLLVQKTGDTYTNPKTGKVYDNLNRNIYGYAPKFTPSAKAPTATQTSSDIMGGGEEITSENVDQVFPFAN